MTPFQAARSSVATVRMTMTKSAVDHALEQECRAVADAETGIRIECVRHPARVRDRHDQHGAEPTHELGDITGDNVAGGELPRDGQSGAYRRVEVPAGEMPEGGDR